MNPLVTLDHILRAMYIDANVMPGTLEVDVTIFNKLVESLRPTTLLPSRVLLDHHGITYRGLRIFNLGFRDQPTARFDAL